MYILNPLWGVLKPSFSDWWPAIRRSVKPISTREVRLCPPYYYSPFQIFKPATIPAVGSWVVPIGILRDLNRKSQWSPLSWNLSLIRTWEYKCHYYVPNCNVLFRAPSSLCQLQVNLLHNKPHFLYKLKTGKKLTCKKLLVEEMGLVVKKVDLSQNRDIYVPKAWLDLKV